MTHKELFDILANEKITKYGGTITITCMPKVIIDSRDEDMIRNPDTWPQWPLLPMKHRTDKDAGGMAILGCLFAEKHRKHWEVYLGSLFNFSPELPRKAYPTLEALLTEWMVD